MPAESMPPYFPFWAKDWITSEATRLMSLAARGAYADLLAVAWLASDEPCTIPSDDASIARLLSVPLKEWRAVAPAVRRHFEPTDSGRLRNARLWAVFCDVQEKREKMSRGGRKGAEHRWKDTPTDTPPDGPANGGANGVAMLTPMATKAKAIVKGERATDGAGAPTRPAISRTRPPRPAAPPWPAEGAGWWVPAVGAMTPGRFGKALTTIVALHGWPLVFPDLQAWVTERKAAGKPCKPEWYADEASTRITTTTAALYDWTTGELTVYGERMTRPDRVVA